MRGPALPSFKLLIAGALAAGIWAVRNDMQAPRPPVQRTGSTDRHLLHDQPVMPQPLSRPRTYRDLDQIPDDFD